MVILYRAVLLLALSGLAQCLSAGWQPSGRLSRGFNVDDMQPAAAASEQGLSRRASLGVLSSSIGLVLAGSPAVAFDNKISNKYDDRPKRRGPKPKDLGVGPRTSMSGEDYVGLKECGAAPNCFCSTMMADDDPDHWIPAWTWPADKDKTKAFEDLYEALQAYPPGQNNVDGGGFQFQMVDTNKGYIYVVYEALKNGYYDDVEFAHIGDGVRTVQVRSSSRIGYLDFGVNAKRLNWIAQELRRRGWNAEGVDFKTHQGYVLENQKGKRGSNGENASSHLFWQCRLQTTNRKAAPRGRSCPPYNIGAKEHPFGIHSLGIFSKSAHARKATLLSKLPRQGSGMVSSTDFQLVASSPFSLLLHPIDAAPSQRTLNTIEESIAITLLKQHNGSIYLEMQAAVQKVDFFRSSNRSQVQFFALANRIPENQTLSYFRVELNMFIEDILVESPLGRASLLRELVSSDDEQLQGLDSFEVVPLQPVSHTENPIPQQPVNPSPAIQGRVLSTLDIILIVCSGLIFVGIMYMIIQHHQDRGYIENQRLRALNHHSSDMDSRSTQSHHMAILSKHSSMSYGHGPIRSDVAPSTPSTVHSASDGQINYFGTPERRVQRINAMTPKALLGASSVDGSSVHSIFEGLESDWSKEAEPKKDSVGQDLHYDASSDTSDDPFRVDVEAASSAAATANDDDRSKSSAAVQEWMLSIQVMPTPPRDFLSSNATKESDVTQPDVDASSGPSLAQTSLDVSDISHRSLEESFATSDADNSRVDSNSMHIVKIEV
eukprot:scaffold1510_cov163-Amphora_coffeaeformis.AAC.2